MQENSKLTVRKIPEIKKPHTALVGVPQWIECWPTNQKVTGSIPSQGTCLGCGTGSQQGACERQVHIGIFSPSHSPSLTLSLKINKYTYI